jgi:hypothetical protein
MNGLTTKFTIAEVAATDRRPDAAASRPRGPHTSARITLAPIDSRE